MKVTKGLSSAEVQAVLTWAFHKFYRRRVLKDKTRYYQSGAK